MFGSKIQFNMKKLYIYILGVMLGMGTLVSCSSDDFFASTLSGDGQKTPVDVIGTVDGAPLPTSGTRAADAKFATNDMIVAYFQHINTSDAVVTDFNKLKNLKVTSVAGSDPYTATLSCTDANGLYWDDFSDNKTAGHDIRETDHGLRTLYAYCYNGGSPSTALTESTGDIGWTIASNQTGADFQKSDLLWAPTITKVAYNHSTAKDADHNKLTLPFKHAMSKVTVILEVGDGFALNYAFTNDAITLNNGNNKFNTVCTATAPTQTLSGEGTPEEINMHKGSAYTEDSKRRCKFEAIVVPSTLAAKDALFATIMADGNEYKVYVNDDMRATTDGKWGTKLTDSKMQSGVNYVLTVHVDKAEVLVEAYITDWVTVTSSPVDGEIKFDNDVITYSGETGTVVSTEGATFNLYDINTTTNPTLTTNTTYGSIATTATKGASNWTNNPKIYWPNGTDKYYFRALAKVDETYEIAASTTTNMEQGMSEDLLWGTTSYHKNAENEVQEFQEGAAIQPRTGPVPIVFYHAMSKISIRLETSTDDAKKVDLTNAKISISNLYKDATLTLHSGLADKTGKTITTAAITNFAQYDGTGAEVNKLEHYLVIPQDFSNYTSDAIVTIELADHTKYNIKLKDCEDQSSTDTPKAKITEWKRGEYYFYTIHLEKEEIKVSAYLKNWEPVTGSGTAELEWD